MQIQTFLKSFIKKKNIKLFIIYTMTMIKQIMTTMQRKIVRQNMDNVNIFIIDETTTTEQITKIVHQKK